jgi:hypothetical protein
MSTSHHPAVGFFGKTASRLGSLGRSYNHLHKSTTVYVVTDRLHDGRVARVPGSEISATVSGWLAELGARSPLVDDLTCAVRAGDWPKTHAIAERLSIEVTVAV